MSQANWERFQQLVTQNVALQVQLSVAKDYNSLVELVVQLAQTYGFNFTVDEVTERFSRTRTMLQINGSETKVECSPRKLSTSISGSVKSC